MVRAPLRHREHDHSSSSHTSTLLPDGKVLISGGINSDGSPHVIAELFDPAGNDGEGTFTPTGAWARRRVYHTATLLPDGKVLISGGSERRRARRQRGDVRSRRDEVGTFRPTGKWSRPRLLDASTLLPDGKVLIAGGTGRLGGPVTRRAVLPAAPTTFLVTNTQRRRAPARCARPFSTPTRTTAAMRSTSPSQARASRPLAPRSALPIDHGPRPARRHDPARLRRHAAHSTGRCRHSRVR